MDRLPNEILRSIFAYLRVNDLIQVRSICRAVCGAATGMLCQKMTIIVYSREKQQNLVNLLETPTVSPFVVEKLDYGASVRMLNELSALLPYLDRLREFQCTFYPNMPPHADDLNLIPLARLVSLPSLRDVILQMYDHHFQTLISTMQPNMVTRLDFQGLSGDFATSVSLSLIAKSMPALRGLFLGWIRLGELDGSAGLPRLSCLCLVDCEGCTSTGLEQFFRVCPLVKRLTLFCGNGNRSFDDSDHANTWVAPLKSVLQDRLARDGRFVWWSLPLENLEYACMDIQHDWILQQPRVHIVLQDSSYALGAATRVYVRRGLEGFDDQFADELYKELSVTDTQSLFSFLIGLQAGRDDWPEEEWDPHGDGHIIEPIETAVECLRMCLITVTTCKSVKSCEFLPCMPDTYTFDLNFDE
ncbi:hypothetical protein BC940DRAFT_318947 [Gongronella butleri]|nr:hypothetical protein BC940DRAFT_318947 [Gongronella butleri]